MVLPKIHPPSASYAKAGEFKPEKALCVGLFSSFTSVPSLCCIHTGSSYYSLLSLSIYLSICRPRGAAPVYFLHFSSQFLTLIDSARTSVHSPVARLLECRTAGRNPTGCIQLSPDRYVQPRWRRRKSFGLFVPVRLVGSVWSFSLKLTDLRFGQLGRSNAKNVNVFRVFRVRNVRV